jgi:hypothetical protein
VCLTIPPLSPRHEECGVEQHVLRLICAMPGSWQLVAAEMGCVENVC